MNLANIWLKITRNPIIVTAYSAAAGAVVSYLQGAMASGDFTIAAINWTRLGTLAGVAAFMAVSHLLTPAPDTNPKQ